MRTRLALAAILWSAVAVAGAQAQVKETLTVSVVEVPVTVVGRDGNPIRGLTAANFEVVDEGKKRPISSFDAIDFATKDKAQALSSLNPEARRNFMLVFDLSFSSLKSVEKAQDAARQFIEKSVLPRDRVAIATLDESRGFRLLTAFTTDRELLASAIRDPKSFHGADPLMISTRPLFDRDMDVRTPLITESAWESDLTPREATLLEVTRNTAEAVQATEASSDQFNRRQVDKQLTLLNTLAETLRAVAGRKQIVLLSEGFNSSLLQGRTSKSMTTSRAEQETVDEARGQVWKVDNDTRFGSSASLGLLQQFVDMCKRSDVVLHAIDIRGVRVQNGVQL